MSIYGFVLFLLEHSPMLVGVALMYGLTCILVPLLFK